MWLCDRKQFNSTLQSAAAGSSENLASPTPVPKANATWLEIREMLAHVEEDKQYSTVKKDLRYEIKEIRQTVRHSPLTGGIRCLERRVVPSC